MRAPKLRVFAGPNGSGKSTIKDFLPPRLIYSYVNADELEKEAKGTGRLDLSPFEIKTTQADLRAFFVQHGLVQKAGMQEQAQLLTLVGQSVGLEGIDVNSYHAAALADFIRHQLLERKANFTFETVMSSRDKVEFIRLARSKGYRTYLYFVATEDPEININRVANRVSGGGHDVPRDRIIERYYRTLELLPEAIQETNRAYLFDNSGDRSVLQVEITDSEEAVFHVDQVADWCMHALSALGAQPPR